MAQDDRPTSMNLPNQKHIQKPQPQPTRTQPAPATSKRNSFQAMTTRGCTTADFQKIADFLDRCCKIALKARLENLDKNNSLTNLSQVIHFPAFGSMVVFFVFFFEGKLYASLMVGGIGKSHWFGSLGGIPEAHFKSLAMCESYTQNAN